ALRTRSCARRSFAAETIFMAFVSCWVFFTDRMRRRISKRLGMLRGLPLAGLELLLRFLDHGDQLCLDVVVDRLLVLKFLQKSRVAGVDKAVERRLERAALIDSDVIEEAVGTGIN